MNRKSAKAAAEFVSIITRDSQGKAKTVHVPGHQTRDYEVILRRGPGYISAECALVLPEKLGEKWCRGNMYGHICYHTIAAIKEAARDQGYKLAVCDTEDDAKRLVHTGGRVITIRSFQGSGQVWAVMNPTKSHKEAAQ